MNHRELTHRELTHRELTHRELTMAGLLADPMTQALMAADKVDVAQLTADWTALARKLELARAAEPVRVPRGPLTCGHLTW